MTKQKNKNWDKKMVMRTNRDEETSGWKKLGPLSWANTAVSASDDIFGVHNTSACAKLMTQLLEVQRLIILLGVSKMVVIIAPRKWSGGGSRVNYTKRKLISPLNTRARARSLRSALLVCSATRSGDWQASQHCREG